MKRLRKTGLFVTMMMIALMAAPPAMAEHGGSEGEEPVQYALLWGENGEEDAMCNPDDGFTVFFTVDEAGVVSAEVYEDEFYDAFSEDGTYSDIFVVASEGDTPPDGDLVVDGVGEECTELIVSGPNGQVNHGTVISALIKALKAVDSEVPLGQRLKGYAKSQLGKGPQQVKVHGNDGESLDLELELETADEDGDDGEGKNNDKAQAGKEKAKGPKK